MSDRLPAWCSALAGKAPIETPRIALRALPEGHVIHVLAAPAADPSPHFERLSGPARSIRRAAPGQWFIVGDERLSLSALTELFDTLSPHAACVDQSHGRVRILAGGGMVERVLAKGTGVDLALPTFPVGHSATTLVGHIAVHMTRLSETAFELMVLRGFAESLWDDLAGMSAEFAKT